MKRLHIREWDMELPEGFEQRREGEHLVLWATGWTVITTVFAYSGVKHRDALLANLRAKAEADDLEVIVEHGGALERFGYLQPEVIQPGHTRLALHAFTLAEFVCLQTAFYLDRMEDLPMALQAWKSVSLRPKPEE